MVTVNGTEQLRRERYQKLEKEYETLKSVLLEFIGYEREWLITDSNMSKKTKAELLEYIDYQRKLMKEIYEKLDEESKAELKIKVEKSIWPIMHNEG
ncbi:hypothetical protein [Bacillus velezensis]|uniref:hypothetical protein n=1 Tax=Bacillus TaxID=1386 RepID=UPI002E1AC224|nr:hypothetical protein [Bacillus velezensis]